MKASLRALLVVTVVIVGGIIYYFPRPATTRQQLLDELADAGAVCRRVSCATFIDGGYSQRSFFVARVPNDVDGGHGRIVPRIAMNLERFGVHDRDVQCRDTGGTLCSNLDPNEDPPPEAPDCACWQLDAGACRKTSDGGLAPRGITLEPDSFIGPGCRRKVCVELAGINSMPEGCLE